MPALAVMSSSCGIWRFRHFRTLIPGGGGAPCAIPCDHDGRGHTMLRSTSAAQTISYGTEILCVIPRSQLYFNPSAFSTPSSTVVFPSFLLTTPNDPE